MFVFRGLQQTKEISQPSVIDRYNSQELLLWNSTKSQTNAGNQYISQRYSEFLRFVPKEDFEKTEVVGKTRNRLEEVRI